MKTYLCLAACLALCPAFAQTPQPPARPALPIPQAIPAPPGYTVTRLNGTPAPVLTKFSLDFSGGTPQQLVAAIEKAMGRPLNAIVADEHSNIRIPPLKVADVNVPQLFTALVKLSYKYDGNRNILGSYGFETEGENPTEDSIWRFFVYNPIQTSPASLTRFDLDFPGGTPKQLAAAIEKASGKPLNVVIPAEHADVQMPPLKMNDVNVSVLFQALTQASRKTVAYSTGLGVPGNFNSYQQMVTGFGFKSDGPLSDTTIWYFYMEKPNLPPVVSTAKICRFYSLVPYLARGLTVDDITTAIQTGWKMLGDKETPTINFHKDTQLLIAVGESKKLETIDAVLEALNRSGPPTPMPAPPAPKSQPNPKPAVKPEPQN